MFTYNFNIAETLSKNELADIEKFLKYSFEMNIVFKSLKDYVTVLMDNEIIIGVLCINTEKDVYPDIYNLTIHPEYRGQNLCRKLIEYTLKQTIIFQGNRYTLDTNPTQLYVRTDKKKKNIPAIKCYENVGFFFDKRDIVNKNGYDHTLMIRNGYTVKPDRKNMICLLFLFLLFLLFLDYCDKK